MPSGESISSPGSATTGIRKTRQPGPERDWFLLDGAPAPFGSSKVTAPQKDPCPQGTRVTTLSRHCLPITLHTFKIY